MSQSRDELLTRITEANVRLAALEKERGRTQRRLKQLQRDLVGKSSHSDAVYSPAPDSTLSVPRTPTEKVRLFRTLFRGRTDVFPNRFVRKRTGKAGYAPACSNKFVPGVCDLPKVKCGECPNQAFQPVDDRAIIDHLQGRHIMGVYPLLEDYTCWFLAADFDKESWKDDVTAFVKTCRSAGVSVSVERSRSGNGAHVWFFFAAPIAAATARKMGCYLVTKTMSAHHQLSMKSYDRLFPNQDTMPRGGFGNLIALPLQHEARKRGNTVFVDEQFEPYSDQWAHLASVSRLERSTIETIAHEAARTGQVIGIRLTDPAEDEPTPWKRPPSGYTHQATLPGPMPIPPEVHAVIAQRLFIANKGLPSPLLNQIKRLAAFQNPDFYKKQAMRLSTVMTPRVITCAEELPQHLALPRGCLGELKNLLEQHGIVLVTEDERQAGEPLEFHFQGELTPIQKRAADALLQHETGIFVAPPGIGKTVLGTYLAAIRGRSTLVLVHRSPLLDQWITQLAMFLGRDEKKIGRIGGGQRKATGCVDVAMLQSLVRKGNVNDIVATYGHVIVDECHHVPAVSFERVLSEVKARYVLGLTATPYRRDGHHPILEMQLGPVRFSVDPKNQAARRPFEHHLLVRETGFRLLDSPPDASIQNIYRELAGNEARNRLILDDVIHAVHEGRSPILLTERRDHLNYFAERLKGFVRHLVVLRGGMTAKRRAESTAYLRDVPDSAERLVLATGRYIGEGFDDARLDTLFLAMPISWKGTLAQYAGRLHRLHRGKIEVRIYDYLDREVPMLRRMFDKRLRTYRAIGYARDAQIEDTEPIDEPSVD